MTTALFVTLIVVGSVLAYCLVAGLTFGRYLAWRKSICRPCMEGRAYPYNCSSDHGFMAFWVGIGWPFALPILLGVYWSDLEGNRAARAAAVARRVAQLEKELGLR